MKLPLISGAKLQTSSWGVNSGTLQGSRLGFKGEEALGNGLSAVFALEMGFDSASGATKSAFDRRAVVGLKGSFGEVLVGRDGTPLMNGRAATRRLMVQIPFRLHWMG